MLIESCTGPQSSSMYLLCSLRHCVTAAVLLVVRYLETSNEKSQQSCQNMSSIKEEWVTSGYWHFKTKGLSNGLPRWGALQSPFDLEKYSFSTVKEVTALVSALGSFLSSAAFLVLRRLKIIKGFQLCFSFLLSRWSPDTKAVSDTWRRSFLQSSCIPGFPQATSRMKGQDRNCSMC